MHSASRFASHAQRLALVASLGLLAGCLIPDYEREDARKLAESRAAAGQPPAAKPVEAPAAAVATAPVATPAAAVARSGTPDAQQALDRLRAGNQRYVQARTQSGGQGRPRPASGAAHPLAIVVTCSEAHVAPAEVFDLGPGEVFVVQVAGNVLGAIELGSIEYAATRLGIPLVLVLGHEGCGAVSAALSGEPAPGQGSAIAERILGNLADASPAPGDLVDQAVRINAQAGARQISACDPILKPLVAAGTLRVVAARYDRDDGTVEVLP